MQQSTKKNLLISNIVSLSLIAAILGFEKNFYIIKIFFISLVCLLALIVFVNSKTRPMNLALLGLFLFFSIVILSQRYVYHKIEFDFFFRSVLPISMGMSVYTLAKYIDMRIFKKYLLSFYIISIIFAMGQLLNISVFWFFSKTIFYNELVPVVIDGRAPLGLASSPFYFGSQMAIITPIVIQHIGSNRNLKFIVLILSFFSKQRAYFLTLAYYMRPKSAILKTAGVVVIAALFALTVMLGESFALIRSYDMDRLIVYFAGIVTIMKFPFGIYSWDRYNDYLREAVSDFELLRPFKNLIVAIPPHNLILNTVLIYGIHTGIILVIFIWYIWRIDSIFRYSILAGLFNSMFHNLNLFYGDYLIWYFIAFHLIYGKRILKKNEIFMQPAPG